MTLTLHGGLGCGSAAIEAALTMAGIEYSFVRASSWDEEEAHAHLLTLNPLGQVPVLVLEDGTVLTESAAILLWIADRAPQLGLVPGPDDPRRAAFLRWIFFVPANLYAMFTLSDFPERWVEDETAQAQLRAQAVERTKFCWDLMEQALDLAPFALGSQMTALDLYIAMGSRWRPGRAWFEASCPRLLVAARETEKHPTVAQVWARNFPQRG